MRTEDLESLFELIMKAGAERRPADFVYLFGQTDDNRVSVISAARGGAFRVGVCGRARGSGFSGFESWRSAMVESGVEDSRIEAVGALESDPLNTLTEARAFVKHCIRSGAREVAVVAPRWHLVRCVMSVVGESVRMQAGLIVLPWLGGPLDWEEAVAHSQGSLRAARTDLVFYETVRILRYVEKQDIPDPGSVLDFLRHLR